MSSVDRSKLPRFKLEELKRKEDEILTKEVYETFVATFEEPSKVGKTFIRGEIVNPNPTTPSSTRPSRFHSYGSAPKGSSTGDKAKREGDDAYGPPSLTKKPALSTPKPKLYKPTPTLWKPESSGFVDQAKKTAEEKAKKIMEEVMKSRPPKPTPKRTAEQIKRTSNLEAFKEELKRAQEERAERRRIRQQLTDQLGITDPETADKIAGLNEEYGKQYDSDPNTTNLFLSNLNPKITEEELCKIFGRYGPLASVKIMWARSDEEKSRGYLCGFVAFMTRIDGERAMAGLRGKMIMNYEMKMGWGKCVAMPPHPIYIPPAMMELTLPPPPSGLPFNAQPRDSDKLAYKWPLPLPGTAPPSDPEQRAAWDKMIRNAVVKVVIPTERPLLCLIHRMVEFVIREGPMFEAMIMNRELSNPLFRFLFDNQSPAHVYYRWKLFSILQGDSAAQWDTQEFRMFHGGSRWRPPPISFFHLGMPPELYCEREEGKRNVSPSRLLEEIRKENAEMDKKDRDQDTTGAHRSNSPESRSPPPKQKKKGQLTNSQRDKLEDMLRGLTPDSEKIADAMVYCVEHADSAEEVVECIAESLSILETPLHKKIARLFLISDILANCSAKVPNVSYFRKFFWVKMETIFYNIHLTYKSVAARLKAEQFKTRVMNCFRCWEETAVFPMEFLIKLQNIFLGLCEFDPEKQKAEDLDGAPLEDVDGVPLEMERIPFSEAERKSLVADYDDLDGVPLDDERRNQESPPFDVGSTTSTSREKPHQPTKSAGTFVPSKWETVEPEVVVKQAMTTSKWEALEQPSSEATSTKGPGLVAYDDEDLDGVPLEDEEEPPNVSHSARPKQSWMPQFDRSPPVHIEKSQQPRLSDMTEEKRQKLREIEVQVVKYQDELESGRRSKRSGLSVAAQVEDYRQSLVKKLDSGLLTPDTSSSGRHSKEAKKRRSRSKSPEPKGSSKRSKRSKSRSRSRSGSPRRHSSSKKHRSHRY